MQNNTNFLQYWHAWTGALIGEHFSFRKSTHDFTQLPSIAQETNLSKGKQKRVFNVTNKCLYCTNDSRFSCCNFFLITAVVTDFELHKPFLYVLDKDFFWKFIFRDFKWKWLLSCMNRCIICFVFSQKFKISLLQIFSYKSNISRTYFHHELRQKFCLKCHI